MNKIIKKSGFTLVELLIVMVILGLLASIIAPKMFSKVDSAREGTAKAQMKVIATALDSYRLDIGYYPESLQELLKSSQPMWDGPYFPEAIPKDPWGNEYSYKKQTDETQGEIFVLKSFGRDGKEGGEGNDADVEL